MAKHLTLSERERISQMHCAGAKPPAIAAAIGRHASTVRRELQRNGSASGVYLAARAQDLAARRRRERPWTRKMEHPEIGPAVRLALVHGWSPDQIRGRLRREHPGEPKRWISHQSIYTWIDAQSAEDRLHWRSFLRRRGKRKSPGDRRGKLKGQVSIEGRPAVVDRRSRLGDWEGDTIVGAGRSGVVVTLVERKSGYLLAAKAKDRQAQRVHDKVTGLMAPLPKGFRRTITFDNGKEFAKHEAIASKLGIKIYFAEPYAAWQRGTNENTNGLLRQYIPKGRDFRDLSWQELDDSTQLLNNRPRRRLGYRTPAEVFARAFET